MATQPVSEKEREFMIDYFKTKIQEHVTYWLGISVLFFTAEQAFLERENNLFQIISNW
jgi:hypothetical protein